MKPLTDTQIVELGAVYDARPDSIHDYDRDPERWVRFVSRRSTVQGLVDRGLAVDEPGVCPIQTDYPVGGYRARLTDEGVAERRRIVAEQKQIRRAIRGIATGRSDPLPVNAGDDGRWGAATPTSERSG